SPRAEGRRDRSRRRARARARRPRRAGGERRDRARPRRGGRGAPPRARGRMSGRRRDPLPLGDRDGLPYSKGLMTRALVAIGVSIELAYLLAKRLELDLAERRTRSVSFDHLDERAAEFLGEEEGARVVTLRRFAALQGLEIPIVLLVGGATGTGKSSVATEVAHVLGITRVTSTDFIRQTIRA